MTKSFSQNNIQTPWISENILLHFKDVLIKHIFLALAKRVLFQALGWVGLGIKYWSWLLWFSLTQDNRYGPLSSNKAEYMQGELYRYGTDHKIWHLFLICLTSFSPIRSFPMMTEWGGIEWRVILEQNVSFWGKMFTEGGMFGVNGRLMRSGDSRSIPDQTEKRFETSPHFYSSR